MYFGTQVVGKLFVGMSQVLGLTEQAAELHGQLGEAGCLQHAIKYEKLLNERALRKSGTE